MNDTHKIAEQKRVSVDIIVNGNPADNEENFSVKGESLLCYSMLANIIKNALEASPEDEKITITLTNEKEKENALIRIHNKGAVPEDIRDKFFDKYVTSGKRWGTGLGTYSARLIAETQGGSIYLDTSEKGYTAVIISFPTKKNRQDEKKTFPSLSFDALPPEIISRMIPFLEDGDILEIENMIDEISSYDVELGYNFKALADNFEYDRILQIIREKHRNIQFESSRVNY